MKKKVCMRGFIAILIAAVVFFAGCSQEQLIEFALENALRAAVDAAVAENEDAAKVMAHMEKRIDLKVVSSEITQSGVTADCRVSSPDLTGFVESFHANDYATRAELVDAICKAVDTAPITTHEMTLGFRVTESGYDLIDIEDFLEAYSGGSFEILQDMQK